MAVFVDDARLPYGRMKMSHMVADSTSELVEMARKLGLRRRWIQKEGTPMEHFDISQSKRELALELGVIPISQREMVKRLITRRQQEVADE